MSIDNMPFSFVMDIYRVKCLAEKTADMKTIQKIKFEYPELFADEFNEFINNLKLLTAYLDEKYNQDFSRIFEAENISRNN